MTEKHLINIGIKEEHIKWLKETKLLSRPSNSECYDSKKMNDIVVPVEKIVGLGLRGESNESWWDHYEGTKGVLSRRRLVELKRSLEKQGLERFIGTFLDKKYTDQLRMVYYSDQDLYFVSEGQHRTTMAKVVNTPSMLINEVIYMELNLEKQKRFEHKKQMQNKLEVLLDKLDFEIKGNEFYWKDIFVAPVKANFDYEKRRIYSESLFVEVESLESFVEFLYEVEDFQARISSSLYLRFKVQLQKIFGVYRAVNRFEKVILELQSQGWKHRL